MDRVFGEGQQLYFFISYTDLIYSNSPDEREEALENESEVTSLIPDTPRRGRQSLSPSRNETTAQSRGWINRVFGGVNTRAHYEPIASSEE